MANAYAGVDAERWARLWLKSKGEHNIQQLDWIVEKDDKLFAVEVKDVELFNPPPYWGTGMSIGQANRRMRLLSNHNIRTLLLVRERNTNNIYHQWLDILESKEYFDTRNGNRIYKLENFVHEVWK